MPGLILFSIGLPRGADQSQWSIAFAFVGVFVFIYVAIVIHGKRLAREWQREIDSL